MENQAIIEELSAQAQRGTPGIDLHEFGLQYAKKAVAEAKKQKFMLTCPPTYRELDTERLNTDKHLLQNRAAIERVMAWKPEGGRGLVLSGPTGGGKTLACWQLIKRLMCDEALDVSLYTAAEWFETLQSKINYGRDETEGWLNAVAQGPIVFIDDFGQEALTQQRTDWAKARFFAFLDRRRGLGLPLIMTTNRSAKQIAESEYHDSADLYGDPLLFRLLAVAEPVKFV